MIYFYFGQLHSYNIVIVIVERRWQGCLIVVLSTVITDTTILGNN